jgi:outer membrane protein TolC
MIHTMGAYGWVLFLGVVLVFGRSAFAVTLEDCLRMALLNNPDSVAGVSRIEAAASMLDLVRASGLPQVSIQAGYTGSDNPPQAFMMTLNQRNLNMAAPGFDPNDPSDTSNVRLSTVLRWRIVDMGRTRLRAQAAVLGEAAAREQDQAVRNELLHQVTCGFYQLLQAQDFVQVRRATLESLDENLRVARERFQAGSVVKTDVLNLEVAMAQSREDLIRASNAVHLAVATLNTLVGSDLVPGTGLALRSPDLPEKPRMPAVTTAIPDRPELRAAARMTGVREQDLARAKREYAPTLSAMASLDNDSADFSGFENSYTAGVLAEWSFLDGGARVGSVREARANLDTARRAEEKVRNQVRLDLREAAIRVDESWERVAVARKSLEGADEALRITGERYRKGATDITELLAAQVSLTAARSRCTSALYDCLMAASNLARAEGQLILRFEGGAMGPTTSASKGNLP